MAGSAATLAGIGPAGAQTAANDSAVIRNLAPRAGAPMSFADLTEQLQPAVVNISTTQRVRVNTANPFAGTPFDGLFGNRQGGGGGEQTREAQSLGSGFIISADGYVVTNNHVVAPGNRNATIESITVIMPDRTEYEAELVGRDAASDIAVLKIKANKPLPFVKFGDSTSARVGDWIIAIGNPFGLGGTVTTGIVSAIHRRTGQGAYDSFLQTDASINRGNSGGPMFDLNGNVIGINNAIISPTGGNVGIGFAIPAEVAAPIVETLKKGQTIERGYLGVQISALSEDLADSLGLEKNEGEFVQRVEPGEAAQKAGIQPGDVIVKVQGKKVTPDQTLSYLVANLPIGTEVPIELIRNGKTIKVNAKLGKRPSEEELASSSFDPEAEDNAMGQNENDGTSAQATADALGLSVVDLTPAIARQIGVPSTQKGVVVSTVDPNSDAAQKGIRRGFLITSVNRQPIATAADLDSAISRAKSSDRGAVLLQVRRGARDPEFVAVRLQDS